MSIVVNDGLEVAAPRSVEMRSGKLSAGKSVPYADVAEALAAIPSTRRYVGLAVNVGGVVYTFKAGILDANLVIYDGRPYKSYVAELEQSGSGAPAATIIENTLGAVPVWSRVSGGTFKSTLAGAFTVGKVAFGQMGQFFPSDEKSIFLSATSLNEIGLVVLNTGSGGGLVDGFPSGLTVEIRVYY